jgi:hypothetical protein
VGSELCLLPVYDDIGQKTFRRVLKIAHPCLVAILTNDVCSLVNLGGCPDGLRHAINAFISIPSFWQEFAEPCRPDMFSSDICCSGTESAGRHKLE